MATKKEAKIEVLKPNVPSMAGRKRRVVIDPHDAIKAARKALGTAGAGESAQAQSENE